MQLYEDPSAWPELGELDPQLAQIIKENPSLATQSLADFVDIPTARRELPDGPPSDLSGVSKSEIQIPVRDGSSIRALVYKPTVKPATAPPLAFTFHGGGWCIGTAEIEEFTSLPFVRQCGAIVISVDYRMAPEHLFPTAIEDSWDALKWGVEHASDLGADPSKGFFVGGSSAGANIAAVLSHLARDESLSPPLTGVYLNIPATCAPKILEEKYGSEYTSYKQNSSAPVLDVKAVEWFHKYYKPDPESELFSPLIWPSSHKGLPKTYIQVCGLDPLRDDGLFYARELSLAGVSVRINAYRGVPHNFEAVIPTLEMVSKAVKEREAGLRWLLEA